MFDKKKVALGNSNFELVTKNRSFFIDKTLFIKEFMENDCQVPVILRPRRFGKTMNLNMLKAFLSHRANPEHFSRYEISKDSEIMTKHFGKYLVIHLSLKDCEGDNFQEMKAAIWERVKIMNSEHRHVSPELAKYIAGEAANNPPIPSNLVSSISRLMNILYSTDDPQQVIVLIDEYDAPLNYAHQKGYYSEAAAFFKPFFSSALKDHPALLKACVVGVMEVRGQGILSGLNNAETYSVVDQEYSQWFGFTKEEIIPFADDNLDNLMEWYNGYTIGTFKMINPWSFCRWLSKRRLESAWVNTGNISTLTSIISQQLPSVIETLINMSFAEPCLIQMPDPLSTVVDYGNEHWSVQSILSFLILAGYLNYEVRETIPYVSIPNRELRQHWKLLMRKMFLKQSSTPLSSLPAAFENFQLEIIRNFFTDILISGPSCHDLCYENSYYMFFFGILVGLVNDNLDARVSSNQESGHGRYDIVIEFLKVKKAVIIEFKKSRSESRLKTDAGKALQQIAANNYAAKFSGYTVLYIGAAFYKKMVSKLESKEIFT